jgi:Protein of unknown function (DUF3037)
MTGQRSYTYIVLRYVHDPLSAEFVNVGVVAHFAATDGDEPILKYRTKRTIGRMRQMFPDMEKADFLSAMRSIDRAIAKLAKQVGREGMFPSGIDAGNFARRALPTDDSSLQWSSVGSGIASDINHAFERLFARHVTYYDRKHEHGRTDGDVWRPVQTLLIQRQVDIELDTKVIRTDDDEVVFHHAWKNGAWHVYEPVSLDLADSENIADKAHRWLGRLASISQDAEETFYPHFIVGAPSDPKLENAYQKAIRILRKAPMQVDVYEENDVEALVTKIAADVEEHRNEASSI